MKTTLEEISAVKKKLHVEIEPDEVNEKLEKAYRAVGKNAKIPGFRPGKVPRKMLERYFSRQVADDVIQDLINESFPKALQDLETFPLGAPLLEKQTLKQGESFKYSAVMEVRPQFALDDYLGVKLEKEGCDITEEEVEERLQQIRKAHGKLQTIAGDRPVQKDDFAVLHYEAFEGDRAVEGMKTDNFLLQVGSNEFHPKFEEQLVGLKKGDETEIVVKFEDTYFHSKLAGREIKFKVKLSDLKEMSLPELNDDFARSLGSELKDLGDLKARIRESMMADEQKRVDRELKKRLIRKISDTVEFELPEVLVEAEIDYAVENVRQSLMRSGSSFEKSGLSESKLREDFRSASEERVKEMLVLGEIAHQKGLTVDENDLAEGYKDLAAGTGQEVETIRKIYEARNLVDSLRERLLEEKTLNYLVEHANITQVERGSLTQDPGIEKEKI